MARRYFGAVLIGLGLAIAIDPASLSIGLTLVALAFFNVLFDICESLEAVKS